MIETKPSRISLIVQPVVIFLALAGMFFWLTHAELTETELATLSTNEVRKLTLEHLNLTVVAGLIILITAIPLGIALTRGRARAFSLPVIALANFGQAAPTVGLIVLFAFWLGFGYWAALAALMVYSFLPVLKNLGPRALGDREPSPLDPGRGLR